MKFVFYRQLGDNDCGATCLRMIAKYYGKSVSIENLRQLTRNDSDGVSLLDISEAAERIGFKTMGVKISYDDILEIREPSILHWNDNHFVVLISAGKRSAYVADPSSGIIKYNREEFISKWSRNIPNGQDKRGAALLIEPTTYFYAENGSSGQKMNWTVLKKYLAPNRSKIVQIFVSLVITSGLLLILPFLTQSIVDTGINTHDLNYITIVLIAQLMVIFSSTFITFIRSRIQLRLSNIVNISILSDFWIKLSRLPVSYFDSQKIGDTMQRINDNKQIQSFLTGQAMNTLYSVINFAVYSLVLILYSSTLFFVFLFGNTLYFFWIMVFMKVRRKLNFETFGVSTKENNMTFQFVQGMHEIKLNNAENSKRWEWENIQLKMFNLNFRNLNIGQLQTSGAVFISQGKDVLISFLVAQKVINGELSFGAMLAIQYIIGALSGPVYDFINLTQTYQSAKISMERLDEVYSLPDEEPVGNKYLFQLPKNKDIRFENVSFSYLDSKANLVLKDITMEIPEGKTTAIVGSSGSGKSTLLKLLLQIQTHYGGRIMVGETEIRYIRPSMWRTNCGAVLQDGYIFSDSIAKNIALGNEEVDFDRLTRCCQYANILSFIESQPKGFNTVIGHDISNLSQGQKQRLLIARAIYKESPFLLLDEATNSLDSTNEKEILENLKGLFKGKTVVVIAHRLSTVKSADNIIVLDKGKIVEQGTHYNLTEKKGMYYQLVKNQLEMEI